MVFDLPSLGPSDPSKGSRSSSGGPAGSPKRPSTPLWGPSDPSPAIPSCDCYIANYIYRSLTNGTGRAYVWRTRGTVSPKTRRGGGRRKSFCHQKVFFWLSKTSLGGRDAYIPLLCQFRLSQKKCQTDFLRKFVQILIICSLQTLQTLH